MNVIAPAACAIFDDLEACEVTFARGSEVYAPLRTLTDHTTVLTRWTPTEEQRRSIAAGQDLYLELLTFGGPLQPIRLTVGMTIEEAKQILHLTAE